MSGMSRAARRCFDGRRRHAIIEATGAAQPPSFDGKGHIAFDHTSRWLADLAAAHLLDRRPGIDHRTILESACDPRRAHAAARRGDLGDARAPSRARCRQQAVAELGARHRARRRPARGDRRAAHHRGGPARRLRVGRSRRRAPARALPEHARYDRLGGTAARPDGHRHRHDRDLRLAGAERRQQPGAARARHLGRALQHGLRAHDRDPRADVLPLLPRPGRQLHARDGAGVGPARPAPDALRGAAQQLGLSTPWRSTSGGSGPTSPRST